MVVNDRTAVAVVGGGSLQFTDGARIVYRFDSTAVLDDVKRSLTTNAPMSLIKRVMITKLRTALDGLSPYVESGAYKQQNAPEGDLVDFILVGYEGQIPTVLKIRVLVDWKTRTIIPPTIEVKSPFPSDPTGSHVLFFGRNLNIMSAANPTSAEAKAANEQYPGVMAGMDVSRGTRVVSSAVGTSIAADLIRLEVQFDSKNVGLPIKIVVLSSTLAPQITLLTH